MEAYLIIIGVLLVLLVSYILEKRSRERNRKNKLSKIMFRYELKNRNDNEQR